MAPISRKHNKPVIDRKVSQSHAMLVRTFDEIAGRLGGVDDFAIARKISREELSSAFLDSSDAQKFSFSSELFRWCQDKLHSRGKGDRLAALVGFAFFVDIEDDQKQLLALAQNLERILPLDYVCLVDGIAHLEKRIAKRVPLPIIPKLFDRCMSLATRATENAVLSSVFLLLRLSSFDSSFFQTFSSELNTVITTALGIGNVVIQRAAVELALKKTQCDPAANEYVAGYLNSVVYVLGLSKVQMEQVTGMLMLLSSLVCHNEDVVIEFAGELFPALTAFLVNNPTSEYLSVLALLCEKMRSEAVKYTESILGVFRSSSINFRNMEVCRVFTRFIRALPNQFSGFANDMGFSLFYSCPDSFFILAETVIQCSPSIVDRPFMLGAFNTASLSEAYVNASVAFAHVYRTDVFKIIRTCTAKLDVDVFVKLTFLDKFSFISQFRLLDYWNDTLDLFLTGDEKVRLAAIPALVAMIKREEYDAQCKNLFKLLYEVQRSDSVELKIRLIELLDDSFIEILTTESLFVVIEQLYEDESFAVKKAALNLINRLREFSPLSVFMFFETRLTRFSETFFQIASKNQRVEHIQLMPLFIKSSGQFIETHGKQLTDMLMRILAGKRLPAQSITNIVSERKDMVYERKVRILALKSLSALSKRNVKNMDMLSDIIDAILDQLTLFKNRKLHLTVIKTLRTIFRRFPVLEKLPMKKVVQIHQTLLQFVRTSTNGDVNAAMMRLFGTIGALDPHEFHTLKSQLVKVEDDYPLYDQKRREMTYLNFVMKYLLGQLREGSKIHDTSVLITAIVYIFQSDASKCLAYLTDVVNIFQGLLLRETPVITPDELFHFFRSIILVVDIHIMPHARDIYEMVLQYLQPKPLLLALKLLCALIYAMKTEFAVYGPETFRLVLKLLKEQDKSDFETVVFLLLALTLITIYAGGTPHVFFDIICEWASPGDGYSEFALLFLCQAMRCCYFKSLVLPSLKLGFQLIEKGDARIKDAAIDLVSLLIIRFPRYALSFPWVISNIDDRLDNLIEQVKKSEYQSTTTAFEFLQRYDAVPDPFPIRSRPSVQPSPLSHIFGRGRLQSSVSENDWSSWLLQLSQELVLCSNSPAIRASHPLLSFTSDFEKELFPFIVVSVWDIANEADRATLSEHLLSIIHNSQTPTEILAVIVSACEAMDRANFSLFSDPFISGQNAERCNSWLTALRFFEKAMSTRSPETIPHLMRIHSLMKRKESALGLLKIAQTKSNCEMLEALSMWSQARDIYAAGLAEDNRNETYLVGFLHCSTLMEDWAAIRALAGEFTSYSRDAQAKVAVFFAGAAEACNEKASLYLNAIRTDNPHTCMWRAIIAVDKGSWDTALQWLRRGQALLSRDMSSFASGSYEPAIPAICTSMIFEEINDMIRQSKGRITSKELLRIWNSKADYIKRDATQLRDLCRVRGKLNCDKEDLMEIKLQFVDSLRRAKEWVLFDNVFDRLLKDSSDERVKLLRVKSRYDRGFVKDLSEFEEMISRLQTGPVFCDTVCAYCGRSPITPQALTLLEDVLKQQPNRVRAWKHWAYFNLGCIQDGTEECTTYASNAMDGFATLIKITRPSLHYLCQLCSLFFRYGPRLSKFDSAAANLTSLSPSSVIQIIPQLMVQFDHENSDVRRIVFEIVGTFAQDHFQAITMPLCLIKRTPGSSKALMSFIEQMTLSQPELMHDAEVFASGMLQIAVTALEEVIVLLDKVLSLSEHDANDTEIYSVFKQIQDTMTGPRAAFFQQYFNHSKMRGFNTRLTSVITKPETVLSSTNFCVLTNAAHTAKVFLQGILENVATIDIAEMKLPLCEATPFCLAIPGVYSVKRESPTITDIGHVLKMIPSAKRPRKLRILGSDGKWYKYLLKGREDLRLDQRIMQLFSLTNSILHDDKFGVEKHLHIRQVAIVPLAPNAGLISWAEGGETIYSMIVWHRKVKDKDINVEQCYIKNYMRDEDRDLTLKLTAIQKVELYRELCSLTPDTDIRETMWLRSQSAEVWLARSTNFARLTGLMSIIGYIMGIGDRHPSNILIMKGTGNVVHIDFSDCFEKASLRAYVHETVPFRLTRMIVRALGPSGVEGVFNMTAEYVMGLMRRNRETLLGFLDIFVQDPITDTLWYKNAVDIFPGQANAEPDAKGSMFKRAIGRVSDKLNGREFDGVEMNVSEQVARLVEIATSDRYLSQMYYGWAPYW